MDGTTVSSESKNPPLVQAKRKIDDTAVSSESKYPALAEAKAKTKLKDPDILDWFEECFHPDVVFEPCCHNHNHNLYLSDEEEEEEDDDDVMIGDYYIPTYLRYFLDEMTAGSGPYNEKTNSVVVTNIPCRTDKTKLIDLFRPFGAIEADVAIDRETHTPECFGFVKFPTREQAQKVIDKGRFVYRDYFTLGVQWVTPKTT